MNKIPAFFIGCLLLGLCQNPALGQQDTLDLITAVKNNQIEILQLKGLGGFRGQVLQVTLRCLSRTPFVLHVPAGQQFASEDEDEQDLIHTQHQYIALSRGTSKLLKLYTMCTQANNMAPARGSGFHLGAMATEGLLAMAQTIAQYDYQASTAQSAVWAVSSDRGLGRIYGPDTAMARRLAQTAAEALNIPMPKMEFVPRPHTIVSIRTSLEAIPQTWIEQGRLVAEDSLGNLITTYFENKRLEPMFRHFRLGVNHTRSAETPVWLRLYDGQTLIAERRVTAEDTISPVKNVQTTVTVQFEVDSTQEVNVGLYDIEDQLYYYLSEKARLSRGTHRSTFQIGKVLPPDVPLWVKIKDRQGRDLVVEKMDPDRAMKTLYRPITLQGNVDFSLERTLEKASLGVYREDGELVRYLFTNGRLNPGPKRYSYKFSHREGPEARFFLRLVAEDGKIEYEKPLP